MKYFFLHRKFLNKQFQNDTGHLLSNSETPNAETLAAADEVREKIASGEKGTKDIDAFFRELDSQCEDSL